MLGALVHAPNSSAEEMELAGEAVYCAPGISSVVGLQACTLGFFFMWDLGSKLGSFGCVASILSVELPDQPSNLLLQHSLIVIHEVCLLFKYTTMEISIFNVSVNFGL